MKTIRLNLAIILIAFFGLAGTFVITGCSNGKAAGKSKAEQADDYEEEEEEE